MGKSHKDKRTVMRLDDMPIRKPKKPRSNGAGFHGHNSDKRKNTRNAQLRAELESEDEEEDDY